MIKLEVSEADTIKFMRKAETTGAPVVETLGVRPRPIRKRGFWRAYRRKELWAFVSFSNYAIKQAFEIIGIKIITSMYVPNNTVYLTWPFI